jgi:hypothetical protein
LTQCRRRLGKQQGSQSDIASRVIVRMVRILKGKGTANIQGIIRRHGHIKI